VPAPGVPAEAALPGTTALLAALAAAGRSAVGRSAPGRLGAGRRAGDRPADLLEQLAYAVEDVKQAKVEVSGSPL
jgi:hypothetical protein